MDPNWPNCSDPNRTIWFIALKDKVTMLFKVGSSVLLKDYDNSQPLVNFHPNSPREETWKKKVTWSFLMGFAENTQSLRALLKNTSSLQVLFGLIPIKKCPPSERKHVGRCCYLPKWFEDRVGLLLQRFQLSFICWFHWKSSISCSFPHPKVLCPSLYSRLNPSRVFSAS